MIETKDLFLESVVLSWREDPASRSRTDPFLRRLAERRGVPQLSLGAYWQELWPTGTTQTFYVANVGQDADVQARGLELLLRPVAEGPLGNEAAVGETALALVVDHARGILFVRLVELTPHVGPRPFEVRVSAVIRWANSSPGVAQWGASPRGMAERDLEQLRGIRRHRATMQARLEPWRQYLAWKEAQIRANELDVAYVAWSWSGETIIAFELGVGERADGLRVDTEVGVEVAGGWAHEAPIGKAGSQRRGRTIDVGTIALVVVPDAPLETVGDAVPVTTEPTTYFVLVRVSEERAEELRERPLPGAGRLCARLGGDLAPVHYQSGGIDRLMRSQGFAPRLADVLFSAASAGLPSEGVFALPDCPGGRPLNAGQEEAVAKALAAPDLCLIQGPPGTGKTTVIAELCRRAAKAGQRVLVASQANLAVDNALARLPRDQALRPLRVGDIEKVDEDYRELHENYVVERWFETIRDHVSHRITAVEDAARLAHMRRDAAQALRAALLRHETAEAAAREAETCSVSHAREVEDARRSVAKAERARDEQRLRHEHLAKLVAWSETAQARLPAASPHELTPAGATGVAQARFVHLDLARARRVGLERLLDALPEVISAEASDQRDAAELLRLRQEKDVLASSEVPEEVARLPDVNKRIKKLLTSSWTRRTSDVERAARPLWPGGLPGCLEALVDALSADASLAPALVEARTLVKSELDQSLAAEREIAALREGFVVAFGEAGSVLREAAAAASTARSVLEALERQSDVVAATRREAVAVWDAARAAWAVAVERSGVSGPGATTPSASVVARVEEMIEADEVASREARGRATRWQRVQRDWLARIERTEEHDREQVRRMYVRRANVVGMTCNEAGAKRTWADPAFEPFDMVIVDEVSRATPTELILPALLGRKLVLVGDHRQLPPLFRESSFQEATADGAVSKEDFERFRRMVTASLFEELFLQAPEPLKATLSTQYRMHPQVMDAVNQFYEGRLEAGPNRAELGLRRAHDLELSDSQGGRFLEPGQHFLWIDSSRLPDGRLATEGQVGTSKVNHFEVELVGALLVKLGLALRAQGYTGKREIEVTREEEGFRLEALLRARLSIGRMATLQDLFERRCVRIGGRSRSPNEPVVAGQRVSIDARKEVGVITFYGVQLSAIREEIDRRRARSRDAMASLALRCDTVDRFQGMERSIVIASLVRSKAHGGLGEFVRAFQRINVGLSRAQELLAVVGAASTWEKAMVSLANPGDTGAEAQEHPVYQRILGLARQHGGSRVPRQLVAR